MVLLGCAWILSLAGPASGSERTGGPVLLAQLRAPIVAQATGTPQQRPRLISLDFKDADINNILRILAEFSGLNIVTSDDVKGKVTVKLQNVPWQQALDSVVRAAKLAYVQEGNIIRVDKLENLTKEAEAAFRAEQREVEIQQRRKEADLRLAEQERAAALARQDFEVKRKILEDQLVPLTEEVFKLRYAHVGVKKVESPNFFDTGVSTIEERGVEEAISGGVKKEEGKPAGMLSARGQLTIDQRTNSLIVRDTPDYLAKIRDFIDKVDRAAPAVLIEARLVEMTRADARSLGIIWGGAWTPRTGSNGPIVDMRGTVGGPTASGEAGGFRPSTAAPFPAPLGTLLGAAGATPFGLGIGWLASNFALDIEIQALEGQARARVLSAPTLMTLENQPATVSSGRDFPVITFQVTQAGLLQPTVEFREIVTRLAVTPRVVGDGRIMLTIAIKDEVEIGQVSNTSVVAPIVGKRNAFTMADVVDGGTVVIAGLRQETFNNTNQGVPWLSKVPVLGWLFKSDLNETAKRELVVFLTAKVVASPGQAAAPPSVVPTSPGAPTVPGPSGQAPAVAPASGPAALTPAVAPVPGPAALTPPTAAAAAAVPAVAPASRTLSAASTATTAPRAASSAMPANAPAARPTPANQSGER
jgi:type IV pilus assembly protein PilQ